MMHSSDLTTPFAALQRRFELPQQTQPDPEPVQQAIHGHAFSIGPFQLLVDTTRYPCEVYEELPLCRLPGAPPHLVGMANQRGNIVPIFDLRKMLGLSSVEGRHYYLVLGERDGAIGFRVNTLPRHIQLTEAERVTTALPVPRRLESHIRQFYQQGEQLIADWNLTTFLEAITVET